jgi:hypothetical protein
VFNTGKSQERTVQTEIKPIIEKPGEGEPESSDSNDEYILHWQRHAIQRCHRSQFRLMRFDVSMIVDTGALTDIIDEGTFNRITQRSPVQLDPTTKRLFAFLLSDSLKVKSSYPCFTREQWFTPEL